MSLLKVKGRWWVVAGCVVVAAAVGGAWVWCASDPLRSAARPRLHEVADRLLHRADSERLGSGVQLVVDVDPVHIV